VTGDRSVDGEAAGAQEAGSPALLPWVVAALGEAGLSVEQYAAAHFYGDGKWWGDRCGCTDDRCIGFHHFGEDDCGCFPVVLELALDELALQGRSQEHAGVQEQEAQAEASPPSWPAAGGVAESAAGHAVDDVQAELGEAGL
jgi:hypothetical protein